MFKKLRKTGLGWKRGLLLCMAALVATLYYFEQPVPGAEGYDPPQQTFIPQFGHGESQGTGFSSSITLINLSTTTSQVSVSSNSSTGSAIDLLRDPVNGDPTFFVSTSVPAGGSAEIHSMNAHPDQIDTGSVSIFSFNSLVVSQTEFSIFQNGQLGARAQVPGRSLRTRGSFTVGQNGRTGLAIVNPFTNSSTADVRLGTVNSDGKIVDTAQMNLDPGHRISQFLDELMGVEGATSAEFRSNVPVAILPLQQDGLVLTTQDVFPGRNLDTLFSSP